MIRHTMIVALVLAGLSPAVHAAEPARLSDSDLDRVTAGQQLLFAFGGTGLNFATGNTSSLQLTSFGTAQEQYSIDAPNFSSSIQATGFSRARVRASGFGESAARASAFAGSGLIR